MWKCTLTESSAPWKCGWKWFNLRSNAIEKAAITRVLLTWRTPDIGGPRYSYRLLVVGVIRSTRARLEENRNRPTLWFPVMRRVFSNDKASLTATWLNSCQGIVVTRSIYTDSGLMISPFALNVVAPLRTRGKSCSTVYNFAQKRGAWKTFWKSA